MDSQLATSGTSTSGAKDTAVPSLQVNCWACATLVQVPVWEGNLANVFKCGWCGAITERTAGPRDHNRGLAAWALRTLLTLLNSAKWALLILVGGIMALIIVPGCYFIVPALYETQVCKWCAWFLAAFFSMQVLFHYCAAVYLPAGRVEDCMDLPQRPESGAPFPPQCFDNHKRCWACRTHKPPGTHHCSICQSCVVGMDHHCPFVNNCVGDWNLRNFVLFLMWVVAAQAYVMVTCGTLVLRHRSALDTAVKVARANSRAPLHLLIGAVYGLASLPVTDLVACLVALVSSSVLLACGAVLWLQLQAMASDTTYVESLQSSRHEAPPFSWGRMCTRLYQVLGGGSKGVSVWWLVLVPHLGPVRGPAGLRQHKRTD